MGYSRRCCFCYDACFWLGGVLWMGVLALAVLYAVTPTLRAAFDAAIGYSGR